MASVASTCPRLSEARVAPAQLGARRARAAGLFAVSVYLRTNSLGESLWMDEGLSIGIASQPLFDIRHRVDGLPPLYYMLLSVWMDAFGNGPADTQALSVAIRCAIPAASGPAGASSAAAPA